MVLKTQNTGTISKMNKKQTRGMANFVSKRAVSFVSHGSTC
jgi:hypothetical protein